MTYTITVSTADMERRRESRCAGRAIWSFIYLVVSAAGARYFHTSHSDAPAAAREKQSHHEARIGVMKDCEYTLLSAWAREEEGFTSFAIWGF